MAGYLAFRKNIWLPVLLGFLLSISMELTQLFVPGRDTSAIDVLTNLTGSLFGVGAGVLFEKIAGPRQGPALQRLTKRKRTDRSALILLFIWAAYLVFPFFPQVGLYVPIQKMKVFAQSPLIAAVPFISAIVSWLAAGKLMNAAEIRHARMFLGLSLLVIPVQFFIVGRQPVPSDLLGALTGLALYIALERNAKSPSWIAAAFLLTILIRGLAPFHFVQQSSAFNWIPFAGSLNAEWQSGLLVILEKCFYYGTAIWLLRSSGIRLVFAGALTAAMLACIEIAQIHLPGRTAETTDPALAVMLAFALGVFSREANRRTG